MVQDSLRSLYNEAQYYMETNAPLPPALVTAIYDRLLPPREFVRWGRRGEFIAFSGFVCFIFGLVMPAHMNIAHIVGAIFFGVYYGVVIYDTITTKHVASLYKSAFVYKALLFAERVHVIKQYEGTLAK